VVPIRASFALVKSITWVKQREDYWVRNKLANRRLQPLGHLSGGIVISVYYSNSPPMHESLSPHSRPHRDPLPCFSHNYRIGFPVASVGV
jgi:hypothetical protein